MRLLILRRICPLIAVVLFPYLCQRQLPFSIQPCLYIIAFDMPAHPVRMNTIESIPEELYSGLNSQVAPLAQSSKVVLLAVLFIPVQMVKVKTKPLPFLEMLSPGSKSAWHLSHRHFAISFILKAMISQSAGYSLLFAPFLSIIVARSVICLSHQLVPFLYCH